MFRFSFCLVLAVVWLNGKVSGYSGGAPPEVCEDMTPKHPTVPQKTPFPYKITVSKNEIKAGEKVQITISGGKPFKGFLLQVRQDKKIIGSFPISDSDRYVKTIDCPNGVKNAVTHKNSADKRTITVDWIAPSNFKGKVQVFVTVAETSSTYWVRNPTAFIKVL